MGKKDDLAKDYLSQNEVFADAYNVALFDGEQVIDPAELKNQDAVEIAVTRELNKVFTKQKMRDVLKLCAVKKSDKATLVLLGIEGQANVHYAMPVRNYLYDALNYSSQLEAIRKKHEADNDLSGDEMISGFAKEDKIVPVITLCICFDKKKWDAPRCLHEMFGNIDPRIEKHVADYKLNLITPDEVEDYTKFTSQLGLVLEFISKSNDKQGLRDIINSRTEYKKASVATVDMINAYTSAGISVKADEGGQVDMCKAINDMMEEARTEGENKILRLLEKLTPGSDEYNNVFKMSKEELNSMYEKYNITG